MTDPRPWIEAVRRSHDRLAALVAGLAGADLGRRSACSEWSVAQVLSHLGSQAEIFSLFVDAGVSGADAPSHEAFAPIWEAWNHRSPQAQASDSVSANEAFVARIESLDTTALDGFLLDMFGRTLDAAGLLRMRLSEHAVHAWDVAVAFDDSSEVAADAVGLLVDGLGETAARSGKAAGHRLDASILTSMPERHFSLRVGEEVRLDLTDGPSSPAASIEMPAEALLRLVYGRVDGLHPPQGEVKARGVTLSELAAVFGGF
ncbi:maleylpyruvate isomerase family mycothiol-dependent enzyme [Acidiferrimicrobium sp. IK]|uniref:maleylpyruvate isomerase family mycothiol-dependent enzyme n=1 Tax=Acidiferrimicrobium sp. IK TaxID=2871700 RepID=UPI0021CAE597|nr:maleylpyruvate isomerase family mycothiol-dependent enzyme [Acidiferrimicrobium sp. IK]MCU4183352.1 maleylpyruvate isomerase family mycothiol-dependent enzyme [Acidiferrimicrobium sp. IK]